MCFCVENDGATEFSAVTRPMARKLHRCEECGRTIGVGERYVRHVAKWEGEINTTVFCAECHAWAMALCTAQQVVCGCSGWPVGGLWGEIEEFTREHLGYAPDFDPEDPEACGWHGKLDPKLSGIAPPHDGFVTMGANP
jgi:hypothetical protein